MEEVAPSLRGRAVGRSIAILLQGKLPLAAGQAPSLPGSTYVLSDPRPQRVHIGSRPGTELEQPQFDPYAWFMGALLSGVFLLQSRKIGSSFVVLDAASQRSMASQRTSFHAFSALMPGRSKMKAGISIDSRARVEEWFSIQFARR